MRISDWSSDVCSSDLSSEYSIDGGARRARSFPDEGRTGGFSGKLTASCIKSYCKWLRHYNFVPGMQLPSPFQTLKDMAPTEAIASAQDTPENPPAHNNPSLHTAPTHPPEFPAQTLSNPNMQPN